MSSAAQSSTFPSRICLGRIVSGVTIALLPFDRMIHMTKIAPVIQAFQQLGFPTRVALGFGILELVCLAIYLHPRSVPHSAMLTAVYLAGAAAMHLRAGSSLFGETLFPVYIGALAWGALCLGGVRPRALALIRSFEK